MAFPTSSVLDDFNRSDEGPPPSSNWSNDFYGASWLGLEVVNNACEGASVSDYSGSYWNVETFGPDAECRVVVGTAPEEDASVGLAIRLENPGNATGYDVEIFKDSGTGEWKLYRTDSGWNFTQLGATVFQDINDGDEIGLEAVGNTITVYHKPSTGSWTELFSRTDSTHDAAGYCGVYTHHNSARVDDFAAGTVNGSGSGGEVEELPQSWQNSAGDAQIRFTADGRVQIGDEILMATDDALIEAHRDATETAKPKRGLHLLGEIAGVLDEAVSWIMQELDLTGSGGISALHSALRVRLTNANTGTMDSGADLRGADIEVINNGGSNGNNVPEVTGLRVGVINESNGYANTAYGVKVELTDEGSLEKAYAFHADAGLIHASDAFEVPVLSSDPSETPNTNYVLLYTKLDGGVPRWYSKDDTNTVRAM